MRNPFIKILVYIFLFISLFLIALNINLISYGFNQLKGQLKIIFAAIPIEEAIDKKIFNESETSKLIFIQEVREFSSTSLGLKENGNYTKVYDQDGKPILWIVTACEVFSMKPYEWEFPIVGKVPYKGFFNKTLAIQEEKRISDLGFDTDISSVSAWSTLGFFKDPILSNMLKRKEAHLAELIIHELTHATIYVESDAEYNENLATFIGEQGAKTFLINKYGATHKKIEEYSQSLEDQTTFGNYMVKCVYRLDSLFQTFNSTMTVGEMAMKKYSLIAKMMVEINQLDLHFSERYNFNIKRGDLPNNTYFMSFKRYREKLNDFSEILNVKYQGDLKLFIEEIHK